MTDETPTPPAPYSARARIEPPLPHNATPPKRLDALPVLYLVGFLILASALIWLWQHPALPRTAALEVARMDTLRQQVDTLTAKVAQLEARPTPSAAPNLAPIEARIAELERRPAPSAPAAPNLAPLDARLAALDARLLLTLPPPVDLGPVQARIDAAVKQSGDATAALARRVDQVEARVGAAEASGKQAAVGLGAAAEQAKRAVQLQAAGAALDAGQPVGAVPGAPPALARFATAAPPTIASLRLGFAAAADAAHNASQPDITDGQPFLTRAWLRAQQAVTVRQGDKVLVGDPVAGVLEHARRLIDAGDIAGALPVLDTLSPPAKSAMTGWMGQAKALIDARAAIAELAART